MVEAEFALSEDLSGADLPRRLETYVSKTLGKKDYKNLTSVIEI